MRYAILLGALLSVSPVSAGDLPRAYFEATEPGSWARYETSIPGGSKTRATYTRLADEDGAFVVEIETEFLEGPGAGGSSTSIFTIAPDFDWKRRFLSFGKALTGATFLMEGRPPMPQPEHMVTAMRDAMADFASGFEAKGTVTLGRIECDLYTFHAVLGGANPGTMEGEVCLSAAVPFGLVHETASSRHEKSGESSFETVLVDSGSEPPRTAPGVDVPMPEPKAKRMDIALAYQRGAIALDFRVPAGSEGRTLEVVLTNLTAEPLVIGIGSNTYAFEVGLPIGTLFFQPTDEQSLEVAPGEASEEFGAAQSGDRGVRSGSFRLVMKRGVPTLSGEMKVGKIR